ncbi:carboxylate-amine ligase [Pseudonocardia humida]|uniref:carboxylate-amine ligase n=1 Tax=Pseudonocardia humida TaxID=2800819 RepID=UPI00207CAD85|nr:glutamate--cysteine ligase [Pseudonocardia humida]
MRSVGVEEEFLLVDPESGTPVAMSEAVLAVAERTGDGEVEDEQGAGLTKELQREQLETGTRPCTELDQLAAELRAVRATAVAAAGDTGTALVPLGTSPLPVEPTLTPARRYNEMARRFGLTVNEQLTCGCHVHVAIDSAEQGVAVLDHIRPWLAPLIALSANSPFWQGEDSGYASFRSQVWTRWPSAGVYEPFGSVQGYRDFVATALATDTLLDEGMLYLDARLSRTHPTVEVRVGDVCRDPDDAVLLAALVRGLVETAIAEWGAGTPPQAVRTEVLRLATWRAGRDGVRGALLDPRTWRPAPAGEVLPALVDRVAPALEAYGDLGPVRELLRATLERGSGADRQRAVFQRTGSLSKVVLDALPGA